MDFLSAVITLFLIMDPLGNVPIFLSVLKQVAPERRRKVLVREVLIAYAVLLFFLLVGERVLELLQIQQETISIAGGIVLFLIAVRMPTRRACFNCGSRRPSPGPPPPPS
jgi:multiple antibiotic resistance protein